MKLSGSIKIHEYLINDQQIVALCTCTVLNERLNKMYYFLSKKWLYIKCVHAFAVCVCIYIYVVTSPIMTFKLTRNN